MGQDLSVNCSTKSIQDPKTGEWKNLKHVERESGKASRHFMEAMIEDACNPQ